jgi:Fanconi anemia group M protein
VRDENSSDVKPYIVSTNISWVKLELPEEMLNIKKELETLLKNNHDFLAKNNFISVNSKKFTSKKTLLELQAKLRQLIDKHESNPLLLAASSIAAESVRLSHALELIETQGLAVLNKYFDKLEKEGSRSGSARAVKTLLSNPVIRKLRADVQKLLAEGLIHPKFHYIVKEVSEWLSYHHKSRVIVFCQYRELAMLLAETLNKHPNIKAKRFIGQATREGDKGISQREQLQILEEFKEGSVNVLVATSVAEEGLDISECELVVFYDFSPSVIRYIQRKGRTGRRTPGNVLILLTKGTRDENYYWIVTNKQKNLRRIVKNITPLSLEVQSSQPTLENYLKNNIPENSFKLVVDNRELSSPIPRLLAEMGVVIIPEELAAGDYVVSEDVAIERKTAADFLQSLIDKRLFEQIIKLKEAYEKPIIIIEGESLYGLRNIHQNAIRGALASIVVDYNLPILWSKEAEETAKLIYAVINRCQSLREPSFSLKKGKLPSNISEIQERLISSLPQVNHVLARRLLQTFKKPINIFNSSEEDLKKVSGIGDKKVKLIKEVLNTDYEE